VRPRDLAAVILVFGSLNIDLVFKVAAPPRAGETVSAGSLATLPGGKGANQAVAAARAGGEVAMAGAVGDDAFGRSLRAALAEAGVDQHLVRSVAEPTGTAAVAVDAGGENQILVAAGANALARAADVPEAFLGPRSTLLLEREVPAEESAALAARAKARGGRVILNLAPMGSVPAALLASLDVLVVNEHEVVLLPGAGATEREAAAFAAHHGLTLVVTLGAAGAAAYRPDGSSLRVGALAVTPVDTTGAGDAFVGVLAAALDRGHTLEDAMRRASVAGALACLKLGAQAALPTAAEIEEALPRLGPAT